MVLALCYRRGCHLRDAYPLLTSLARPSQSHRCARQQHSQSSPQSRESIFSAPIADEPQEERQRGPRSIILPFHDDHDLGRTSGFWPAPELQPDNASKTSLTASTESSPFSHLFPGQRVRKHDLAELDPSLYNRETTPLTTSIPFRASAGLRKILLQYITRIEPLLRQSEIPGHEKSVEQQLHEELRIIFPPSTVDFLRSRSYETADVASWAWVLTAPRVSQVVKRYVTLTTELLKQGKPLLPRFIPLQILRVDHLSASSFTSLLSTLTREVEKDSSIPIPIELDGPSDISKQWRHRSPMILAIRLLRHARNVAPSTFNDIAILIAKVLIPLRQDKPAFDQLTFICNRILTLFSLPCQVKPYRSVKDQQRGQLTFIRRLMVMEPEIPVTREGYRALIKVQLIHEKTEQEKAWSKAQAESWPPFQKFKMGIESTLDNLSKESRAMKLLRRMTEAGYAYEEWEKAASILAGWDIDRSPTIQTRRILDMPQDAAASSILSGNKPNKKMTAALWAARVASTRTVREAWACFINYRNSAQDTEKQMEPYEAMFEKLYAPSHQKIDGELLPGDTNATFPDPISDRDLVYLERDIPSSKNFYALMIADGIKPSGRLLSLLCRHARTLGDAVTYINDSSYGRARKDILLYAYKYEENLVQGALNDVPHHFFVAYLDLLFRAAVKKFAKSHRLGAFGLNFDIRSVRLDKPDHYALTLLFLSKTFYLPAYNVALNGIYLQVRTPAFRSSSGRPSKAAWFMAGKILRQMKEYEIDPDWKTFYIVGSIIRQYLKAPAMPWMPQLASITDRIKELFAGIVYGSGRLIWLTAPTSEKLLRIPDPEHIRILIEVLGILQDVKGLLEALEWISDHAAELIRTSQEINSGAAKTQHTLAIARTFLWGAWAEEEDYEAGFPMATQEAKMEIEDKIKATSLPWPTDDELEEFLEHETRWLQYVRSTIKNVRTVASKQTQRQDGRDEAKQE